MTLIEPFGTALRLLLALSFVAGCVGLAPEAAQAQNLVNIHVPDFRARVLPAPDVRLPNARVPVIDLRTVRAPDIRGPVVTMPSIALPQVTLPPAPNFGSALVFHGNYCGLGSRGPDRRPVDALDAACARHDACTPPPGALASCGCNARLQRDAMNVAMSPRTPEDTRVAARFVAESIKLVACR